MAGRRAKGEGSIYRRKSGGWAGQFMAGNKRRYVYGKTKKEVADKLKAAIAERDAGRDFEAGNVTLAEYLNHWLTDVRDTVRPQTLESYALHVRRHIGPALGHVKLANLTPGDVQGFYRDKLDTGLSARSVEYSHVVLNRALKAAVRRGAISRNVCEAVDPPRPAKKDMQPLSPEQARTLLSAASGDRLEALYTLAATAGLRQGELLGLLWKDVDLEAGRLHIRRVMVTRSGGPRFDQPKTNGSRRAVTLTPLAVSKLEAHAERQRAAGLYGPDALVFSTRSGKPISPQNLTKQSFRPLLERAGLPVIRFHDLRHTCATLLLGRGVHPRVVQDLLGHASVTLTLDTYSHVLPAMQAGAADAMGDALGQ